MANKLIVSAAPHITGADTTSKIMQRVCLALVPTLIASTLVFGISSLILTAVTVAACVLFEYGYCKMMGREVAIDDFSAVVTGMLLAFNLPAGMPVWMAVVGAFIAIVIVKQLFGGMGYNFANPAIVGRIALAIGYASRMATYPKPANGIDALSSATPLAVVSELGSESYMTLLMGNFHQGNTKHIGDQFGMRIANHEARHIAALHGPGTGADTDCGDRIHGEIGKQPAGKLRQAFNM